MEDHREQWAACTRCALRDNCTRPVYGEPDSRGDISASPLILVVGVGPGRAEADAGLPFQGPAGTLLREILEAGDARLTFQTTLVACRVPRHAQPTTEQVAACSDRLVGLVELAGPAGLVFVGEQAATLASGARWAVGLPAVTITDPALIAEQGHPNDRTRKQVNAQVGKVQRLVRKATKPLHRPKKAPIEEAHVHTFKYVGHWVNPNDPANSKQMNVCPCGVAQ